MPGLHVRETGELVLRLAEDDRVDAVVPRHESEVSICNLVADEPLPGFEPRVQDAENALQLIVVAFYGRRYLLRVQNVEPGIISTQRRCLWR